MSKPFIESVNLSGDPIIYLSIPGVLTIRDTNGKETFPIERMAILNRILAKVPSAKVIIMPGWRYSGWPEGSDPTVRQLEWLLRGHGLMANRVLAIAPKGVSYDLKDGRCILIHNWPMDDFLGSFRFRNIGNADEMRMVEILTQKREELVEH